MHKPSLFLLLAVFWAASADAQGTADIRVSDAWIRWLPAGVPAAGYMTVTNGGTVDHELIGASSPDFRDVGIHQTHDMAGMPGMSEMTPVASIRLKAHATVRFAEGGYHLMLAQPKKALHPGDKVVVILRMSDGQTLEVPFDVRDGTTR
jgi:copper(I)-binding protein